MAQPVWEWPSLTATRGLLRTAKQARNDLDQRVENAGTFMHNLQDFQADINVVIRLLSQKGFQQHMLVQQLTVCHAECNKFHRDKYYRRYKAQHQQIFELLRDGNDFINVLETAVTYAPRVENDKELKEYFFSKNFHDVRKFRNEVLDFSSWFDEEPQQRMTNRLADFNRRLALCVAQFNGLFGAPLTEARELAFDSDLANSVLRSETKRSMLVGQVEFLHEMISRIAARVRAT